MDGPATIPTSTPDPAMLAELLVPEPADERVWVLSEPDVWWRPLFFDLASGSHAEVLRARRAGVLSRHLHPGPVMGYTLKGRWHYREHDWVAEANSFLFEPPGEIHTLENLDPLETQIFFVISGAVVYLDEADRVTRVEDNMTLIREARAHYEANGLGANYIERFFR